MARIPRWLHYDPRKISIRPTALSRDRTAGRMNAREHVGEKVLLWSFIDHGRDW
jgi:hypothetical protein